MERIDFLICFIERYTQFFTTSSGDGLLLNKQHTITLTHWGRVTYICISKLAIIGRRQTIIWTNARILLIGPLGTNLNEILIESYIFSFKKMCLTMSSGNWHPFCLGLNVLTDDDDNQCLKYVWKGYQPREMKSAHLLKYPTDVGNITSSGHFWSVLGQWCNTIWNTDNSHWIIMSFNENSQRLVYFRVLNQPLSMHILICFANDFLHSWIKCNGNFIVLSLKS